MTSLSNISKVKIKLLKNNKVVCSIFDDENYELIKNPNNLKVRKRIKLIDIYLTTEIKILEFLEKNNKNVVFLDSEDVSYIKLKLSESLKIKI